MGVALISILGSLAVVSLAVVSLAVVSLAVVSLSSLSLSLSVSLSSLSLSLSPVLRYTICRSLCVTETVQYLLASVYST